MLKEQVQDCRQQQRLYDQVAFVLEEVLWVQLATGSKHLMCEQELGAMGSAQEAIRQVSRC